MLIDTHAHLWFDVFKNNLDEVLERAKVAGVEKIIVPGTDIVSSKQAVEIAKIYPGLIYAAVGIHPEELNDKSSDLSLRSWQTALRSELGDRVVAIGEIGTDASTIELRDCMSEQKELFREQCELALEYDLPVIIHTRNSLSEALEVLDSLPRIPNGQFHCFSHDEAGMVEVLQRGFFVSFAGNITWSKRVARLVNLVPDDKLLLETDSPFMMPRNTPSFALASSGRVNNEPENVAILAEKIAQLRGQTSQKVTQITTSNAIRLFRL